VAVAVGWTGEATFFFFMGTQGVSAGRGRQKPWTPLMESHLEMFG